MSAFLHSLWGLTLSMSPYLLLGFFIAGVLHAFVPARLYVRHLSRPGFRSVLNAALLGVPLPLCSCGVLPTTIGLRRSGASRGACTAFLITTPQTGVDSILATYSLLGLPFAVVRPLAALVTGLAGGVVTDHLLPAQSEEAVIATSEACKHTHTSFLQRLVEALRYAFVELLQDVGKWLVVGLVAAALITVAVPADFFDALQAYPAANMLLVLLLAVPMYLCATGSIPIALSLVAKGLTPGAAFVLLMAGPAINVASMLVVNKAFGVRQTVCYLLSIVAGALAFGLAIDYLLPAAWFAPSASALSAVGCAACGEGVETASVFSIVCGITFLLLLAIAVICKRIKGETCSCTSHAHSAPAESASCGCHAHAKQSPCGCKGKHEA